MMLSLTQLAIALSGKRSATCRASSPWSPDKENSLTSIFMSTDLPVTVAFCTRCCTHSVDQHKWRHFFKMGVMSRFNTSEMQLCMQPTEECTALAQISPGALCVLIVHCQLQYMEASFSLHRSAHRFTSSDQTSCPRSSSRLASRKMDLIASEWLTSTVDGPTGL